MCAFDDGKERQTREEEPKFIIRNSDVRCCSCSSDEEPLLLQPQLVGGGSKLRVSKAKSVEQDQ